MTTILVANQTTHDYVARIDLYIRGALKRIEDPIVLEKSLTSLVQVIARDFIRACPRVEQEKIYAFAQDMVNSFVNAERRLIDFEATRPMVPSATDRRS